MEEKRNEVMVERKKKNKKYELCGVAKLVQRYNLASRFCCKGSVHPETNNQIS